MSTRLYVILYDEMAEDLPDEDNPVYLQYLRLRKRLRHYAGRTDEEDYPRITRWLPGDEDRYDPRRVRH
uniref:Uncharacterized protein n=1 Tax=Trichogramma kaykai TaxID=54128 RepID=A0ABD2XL38_9HYME